MENLPIAYLVEQFVVFFLRTTGIVTGLLAGLTLFGLLTKVMVQITKTFRKS